MESENNNNINNNFKVTLSVQQDDTKTWGREYMIATDKEKIIGNILETAANKLSEQEFITIFKTDPIILPPITTFINLPISKKK